MDRTDCNMNHWLGNKIFCSYYDVFYMRCDNVKDCPEHLDDDEDDDFDEENEDGSWEVNY